MGTFNIRKFTIQQWKFNSLFTCYPVIVGSFIMLVGVKINPETCDVDMVKS
ncbi:MAG: hypothetical protein OES23_02475 [Nitrosopumilus sp.]|nr:hypothetical protein [Nitrosopumilus sp.]